MNRVTVIKSAKTREVVEVATEGLLSVTTATVMGILQETAENLAGDREAVIVTRMIEEAIPQTDLSILLPTAEKELTEEAIETETEDSETTIVEIQGEAVALIEMKEETVVLDHQTENWTPTTMTGAKIKLRIVACAAIQVEAANGKGTKAMETTWIKN